MSSRAIRHRRNRSSRRGFPDISVPPECREKIRRGALVALNHSGGKDSQAMTILLSRIVPREQTIVVHAPLGEVEWPATAAQIEATIPEGVPLILAPVASGKSLLDRVEERGKWPDPARRWCTSDFKASPIARELRRHLKAHPRFGGSLVNCLGLRRDESAARAKRVPWRRNERLSVAGREVFDWLPIFDLSTDDVFRVIRDAGQSPHWIYRHLSRCSCSFCIFSSPEDLRRAAQLRPELYARYAEIERRIGHTLSPSGIPLPELTGVSPSEAGDSEDAMALGSPRSRPAPARRPRAGRNGLKPPCPESGAAQGSG